MTPLVLMVATPPVPASSPMQWLPLVLIIPVIIFWAWMFRDMLNNDSSARYRKVELDSGIHLSKCLCRRLLLRL